MNTSDNIGLYKAGLKGHRAVSRKVDTAGSVCRHLSEGGWCCLDDEICNPTTCCVAQRQPNDLKSG